MSEELDHRDYDVALAEEMFQVYVDAPGSTTSAFAALARWLTERDKKHDAEVAAEAYDEGAWNALDLIGMPEHVNRLRNPYRKAGIE